MQSIILFGTGFIGKKVFHFLKDFNISIKYWIDSNPEKQEGTLYGLSIYEPKKLYKEAKDYVCIAMKDTKNEVRNCILSQGVSEDRIISYTSLFIYILEQYLPTLPVDLNGIEAKRKIIIDCTSGLDLGGVEAWSVELLGQMEAAGYDAYVIAPFGQYQVSEGIQRKIIFVDLNIEDTFSRHNIERLYQNLQKYCPCTLISKSINDLFFASCIIKKKNSAAIQLFSVIHQGLDFVYKENTDVSEYVDRYIAVSEDIRNGMIAFGIASNRVLHMTCPVECPEQLCREYSINTKNRIKLGYAGRLVKPQKRLDLLLQVLDVLEEWQCEYELEIAGDGSFSDDIYKFVHSRQLQEQVKMLGKIDRSKIPEFWRRQDICINIADHEGRSISIMEAMANGAVPVVTATSGVKEDITDSINGFIVDVGDYKAIAGRIRYLSQNRQELGKMGNRAHDVILQKCSMSQHMEFWIQVLNGL